MQGEFREYVVRAAKREVPGVVTLSLSQKDGAVPPFVPGQYINVYFSEAATPEGKAYSISSAPGEPTFSITVRGIGEFSNRLCALAPGDTLRASLPYGFFRLERNDSDAVMLAAGIGVAPFRSMIRDAAHRFPARRMTLFHSVRTASDAIYREEFAAMQKRLPHFSLTLFITREDAPQSAHVLPRRMQASDILARVADASNTEFLICGSIAFTRDMWKELRSAGVSEDSMYTEAFFSH